MKSDFSSIFSIPSWFWHYPYEEDGRSPGRDSSKDRGTESDNSPLLLSTGNLQSSSVLWMYLFVWYSLIIASVMNFPNSFSIPFHFSISFSDESHSLITYYIQKRRSVNLGLFNICSWKFHGILVPSLLNDHFQFPSTSHSYFHVSMVFPLSRSHASLSIYFFSNGNNLWSLIILLTSCLVLLDPSWDGVTTITLMSWISFIAIRLSLLSS